MTYLANFFLTLLWLCSESAESRSGHKRLIRGSFYQLARGVGEKVHNSPAFLVEYGLKSVFYRKRFHAPYLLLNPYYDTLKYVKVSVRWYLDWIDINSLELSILCIEKLVSTCLTNTDAPRFGYQECYRPILVDKLSACYGGDL